MIQNVEVAVVLGATVLVAAAISLLIFKYILSPTTYRNSSLACCLLGYGIIVPFWIFVPVYAVKTLNIRNKVFRFVFGTVPTLSFFRTFEGKYSTCGNKDISGHQWGHSATLEAIECSRMIYNN
jgi:uncharacterized membrane protein YciS (DUF1049 family)